MALFSIIICLAYLITGHLIIPIIILLLTCWYLDTVDEMESYNPLKWIVKMFGIQVKLDDEYYYDNYESIIKWLSDNHNSWRYYLDEWVIPPVIIYNDLIYYDKKIVIRFFSRNDAVQFKMIFNKNS